MRTSRATAAGLIVCGRQTDPRLAEPISALAAAAGYPILAEPTSQLRRGPHDRSLVVSAYDSIARDRPTELEPELILRFGEMPTSKPLRQWLAAIAGLRQIVVDPVGEWREPTRRADTIVRADPTATARSLVGGRLRPGRKRRRAGSPQPGWMPSARCGRPSTRA